MSKKVEIELCEDLQKEFTSWMDACESLGVTPKINTFLNYISNYGTYTNPKED